MGMALGKRGSPQGEMIGLGSGSRAGMSPAGDEGTMGPVNKFLVSQKHYLKGHLEANKQRSNKKTK